MLAGARSALDLEPEHGAETAGLLLRQLVLREGFEPRVAHFFHFCVALQILGDGERVGALYVHAHRKRFATLHRQPCHLG